MHTIFEQAKPKPAIVTQALSDTRDQTANDIIPPVGKRKIFFSLTTAL